VTLASSTVRDALRARLTRELAALSTGGLDVSLDYEGATMAGVTNDPALVRRENAAIVSAFGGDTVVGRVRTVIPAFNGTQQAWVDALRPLSWVALLDRFRAVTAQRVVQLRAMTPVAGDVRTSSDRVNRLHRMAQYSMMSNMMSTFTDCPGREKLSYPADYVKTFGSLHRNFNFAAYLRTTERHLVEGQSRASSNIGNVALKAPVYDWGYLDRFGDEINWGNGIVLVPWLLYEIYGDTQTMARVYPRMQAFLNYITTQKAGTGTSAFIVDAALADWAAADSTTSGRMAIRRRPAVCASTV